MTSLPAHDADATDPTDERRRHLAECVDEYVAVARAMTVRHLRAHQQPPLGSLMFGAAGIAYALWRHDPTDPAATRWLDSAARLDDEPAWLTPQYPTSLEQRRLSVATGAPGLLWMRLLIALSSGRTRSARHWARALVRVARPRPAELLLGDAGHLLALVVAADRAAAGPTGPLPELESAVDDLRERLSAACAVPHRPEEVVGLARGRLGVHHALLVARRRAGEAPADHELDGLAALADRLPRPRGPGDPMTRSWCNGTSGAVLAWVAAHRATGDPAWLDLVRRDAATLTVDVEAALDPGNLCCGTGGWAQACLAADEVLPGQGWHDHALTLAAGAFEHLDTSWPHGLLRGYPGLVCLALDLDVVASPVPAGHASRGFPLVSA